LCAFVEKFLFGFGLSELGVNQCLTINLLSHEKVFPVRPARCEKKPSRILEHCGRDCGAGTRGGVLAGKHIRHIWRAKPGR